MSEDFGGLGLQEELETHTNGFHATYVNGTDSLDLPEDTEYQAPTSSWDEPLDNEEEDAVYKKSQPPGGYYLIEGFRASEVTREAEFYAMVDDGYQLVKRPRTITTYSGKGFQERDGKIWTPQIRVRVSPERAYAKDKDGQVVPDKLDSASKLFQHARLAYREVIGEPARTKRDIDDFLRSYSFKVQTMQLSDGSLLVLGLQGIKPA